VHQLLVEIAAGDADLTKALPVVSRDEVGQICANFNAFLTQLRSIMTTVQGSMVQTQTIAGSLHTDSIEVAASLGEINANNQGISENMGVLDSRLGEADGSTREMLQALDGLKLRVGVERGLVETSTTSVRGMIDGIGGVTEISRSKRQAAAELVTVSRESGRQLEEASAAVGRINSAVDTILEMTEVVSAIASQTNLLSMNAAIEAAHAGSAGAGFSVVADEIRKLATTSTSQSADIGRELNLIVGEIQVAWDLTHQAQSSYGKLMDEVSGVSQALVDIMQRNENLQALGGDILGSLEGLSRASHAVGRDMETIDRSATTVGSTMEEVRRVSSEVSTGMKEIAQGTQDITMATQNGSSSNRLLVDQVQAVLSELGRFKVSEEPRATTP
jgi:methyl-accepting chemotaxis protein